MTAKPIPFTRAMALAAWEGRKTQTRRVLKNIPDGATNASFCHPAPSKPGWQSLRPGIYVDGVQDMWFVGPSKFYVGDRLWVREPYWQHGHWELIPGATTKGGKPKWGFVPTRCDAPVFDRPREFRAGLRHDGTEAKPRWYARLARFMPCEYSRQTLIVTDVRAQRLQDISEEDAIAEGALKMRCEIDDKPHFYNDAERGTHKIGFAGIWAHINGAESWDANPWVVAVSFKTIRANVDSAEARAA